MEIKHIKIGTMDPTKKILICTSLYKKLETIYYEIYIIWFESIIDLPRTLKLKKLK
jgi:hypothetical protein